MYEGQIQLIKLICSWRTMRIQDSAVFQQQIIMKQKDLLFHFPASEIITTHRKKNIYTTLKNCKKNYHDWHLLASMKEYLTTKGLHKNTNRKILLQSKGRLEEESLMILTDFTCKKKLPDCGSLERGSVNIFLTQASLFIHKSILSRSKSQQ